MMINKFTTSGLLFCCSLALTTLGACSDNDITDVKQQATDDYNQVGKTTENFDASEWYPGGKLGTSDDVGKGSFEAEAPVVNDMGQMLAFQQGEMFFKNIYTLNTAPFKGWGPIATRRSCFNCHIQYGGRAYRQEGTFKPEYGNGYVLQVYTPDSKGSNNGKSYDGLNYFTQMMAASPFLPPVDPKQVTISWKTVTEMPSGLPLHFPDGESYSLIYPVVDVPQSAFNTMPKPDPSKEVRVIASLPLIGMGLIDAIPTDSIEQQYRQEGRFAKLNPKMYSNGTFPETAYVTLGGRKIIRRFNNDLLSASLEEDFALWNQLGVSRRDLPNLCSTEHWAEAMSQNEQVIDKISHDPTSPYYAPTKEGIRQRVRALLSPKTNQFDNPYHNFKPELDDEAYHSFMVWHRGLAVPRARNLNDPVVQRGKALFYKMGCIHCHRPSWTTGDDDYYYPQILAGKKLPRFPHQKIYPYTDFIEHRLHLKNDIHNEWCRTPPLWGRGLMIVNTGHQDRMHDLRARNEVEAIMWHVYSKESDAYHSAIQFYHLPKADRDAVVKFLRSI